MTVRSARAGSMASSPHRRPRRGAPLVAYMVGLVALFALVAGADDVYQREAAASDARQASHAAARLGATTAAREISAALDAARAQVAALASNPEIRQAFAAPAGCTLQFGGSGAFSTGHLDLVRSDGTVACSSLASRKSPRYAGATWLMAALKGPALVGPAVDVRTGGQAVVEAAPVPGMGTAIAVLDFGPLARTVAS